MKEVVEETAESIYRDAEGALGAGRRGEAREALAKLLDRFPEDRLAQAARYELARIALDDRRPEAARRHLVALLKGRDDTTYAEVGQRLLCQLDVDEARYDAADACWRSFRARFPDSPHDAEALANRIALAARWRDCARVRALVAELAERHPASPLLEGARQQEATCR